MQRDAKCQKRGWWWCSWGAAGWKMRCRVALMMMMMMTTATMGWNVRQSHSKRSNNEITAGTGINSIWEKVDSARTQKDIPKTQQRPKLKLKPRLRLRLIDRHREYNKDEREVNCGAIEAWILFVGPNWLVYGAINYTIHTPETTKDPHGFRFLFRFRGLIKRKLYKLHVARFFLFTYMFVPRLFQVPPLSRSLDQLWG